MKLASSVWSFSIDEKKNTKTKRYSYQSLSFQFIAVRLRLHQWHILYGNNSLKINNEFWRPKTFYHLFKTFSFLKSIKIDAEMIEFDYNTIISTSRNKTHIKWIAADTKRIDNLSRVRQNFKGKKIYWADVVNCIEIRFSKYKRFFLQYVSQVAEHRYKFLMKIDV